MATTPSPPIPVFGCATDDTEVRAMHQVLTSQWLGMGPKVADFEEKFKEHGNLKNFLMLDSGSNALYLALKLLDLPPGSEVVLPSFTWIACANAVQLAGCLPIFCDVDINTSNVTATTIAPCLSKNTGAILVVHHAGCPVDLTPIRNLGYPIVEDAAHAADGWYKNQLCGSIGEIGIYSFNATKNIASGSGGGITTRDAHLMERARSLRYSGIGESGYDASARNHFPWWNYRFSEPFIKMLPSDLNASIAIAQLEKLTIHQNRRGQIWETYKRELRDINWLLLPNDAPADCIHGYFTFVVRIFDKKRDLLAKHLLERGIYTTVRYPPLHHIGAFNHRGHALPHTESLYLDSLCLPLHPALSAQNLAYIIDAIRSFS